MATTLLEYGPYQGVRVFGWDLASGETGDAAMVAPWPDKTVQIYGMFNTGNIQIEGSLDPVSDATPTYKVVRDTNLNLIATITAAYLEAVQPHCVFIRPVATTITAVSIRIICSAARSRTS